MLFSKTFHSQHAVFNGYPLSCKPLCMSGDLATIIRSLFQKFITLRGIINRHNVRVMNNLSRWYLNLNNDNPKLWASSLANPKSIWYANEDSLQEWGKQHGININVVNIKFYNKSWAALGSQWSLDGPLQSRGPPEDCLGGHGL